MLMTSCASAEEKFSLEQLEHIHSVATDQGSFYLASHHGLYSLSGGSWSLVGEEFDVMGLDISEGIFYASGHPGPTQDWADPVGILVSKDQGETWTPKTFMGEVDFHLLEVSGESFIGVAANYGLVVGSSDGANTWTTLDAPGLRSLSVNPKNGNELLIVSDGVLLLSKDAGLSFEEIKAPTNLVQAVWFDEGIYLSTDVSLFFASALTSSFTLIPQTFSRIQAAAAQGENVIVLDQDGVHISKNAGKSFELLP